jgi:hypothetical protein
MNANQKPVTKGDAVIPGGLACTVGLLLTPACGLTVLMCYIKYDQVLRTDLALVKLQDYPQDEPYYKDGVIVFPTIKKTNHKNIQIELLPGDILLVEAL